MKVGYIIASREVTEGDKRVGYLYREQPDNDNDSGWRVFSGEETQEFADDPANFAMYNASTIVDLEPSIRTMLGATAPAAFELDPSDTINNDATREHIKVLFDIERNGDALEVESVWTVPVAGGFRLDNIPFYDRGFAWGGVVAAAPDHDGMLRCTGLVAPSGHSTIRLWFANAPDVQGIRDELRSRGCTSELDLPASLQSMFHQKSRMARSETSWKSRSRRACSSTRRVVWASRD